MPGHCRSPRKALFGYVLIVTLLISSTFSGVSAQPACIISGTTYRDYNDNGSQQALEPPQGDIVVRAYSATGLLGTATSADDTGAYSLSAAAAGEVRVEFTWPQNFLFSARFGASSHTTVTFVDCAGGAVTLDMGLSQPSQYCHISDPELGTSCYVFADPVQGPSGGMPAFVAFPSAGFVNADAVGERQLALANQIGVTWGLGYHRSTDSFMVGAFLKRHAGFGPGGPGAIYRIRPSTGQVSLFLDLNTLPAAFNAGTDPHPANVMDCPANPFNNCWQYDTNAYNLVGKMALGDVDVSEDDRSLYVVNLQTRELIVMPIGYNAAVPPAGQMQRYDLVGLPGLTCPAGDRRPFGIGTHDNRVYVGIVCSAESSQNAADLRAFVYSFDPLAGGGFQQELNFPLNYPRICADQGDINCPNRNADWMPWAPGWPTPDNEVSVHAEPMLTDIVFDNQAMILGFRDRFGDRTGFRQPGPFVLDPANPESLHLVNGITAGDMLRACRNLTTGVWTLENNGSCGGVTTAGQGNNEGPGNGEYYFHDRNNPNMPADGGRRHDEISMGGLVNLPGSSEVAMTVFDPLCETCAQDPLFDGGVAWLNNQTGQRARSYRIFDGPQDPGVISPLFGKANGLGDLEAVCGPAPLEIGNRVWEDLDRNGRQDPGEAKLGGVIVNLYMDTNGDGSPDRLLSRTTTNADGEYYFNEANVFSGNPILAGPPEPGIHFIDINGNGTRDDFEPAGLNVETVYEVRLDDPANYGGGPLTNYFTTLVDQTTLGDGNDNSRDSDGINPNPLQVVSAANFPVARVTTRGYADNDHTYDFGFSLLQPNTATPTIPVLTITPGTPGTPPPGGDIGITKQPDNPFGQPGQEVAWTITVTNSRDTAATNVVVEDRVPDQLEILSVPSNATVNGQVVRITFDVIPPRSSVTAVIRTRIRANVAVPFIIVNPAQIIGGPGTQAQIISVERLPETGETPLVRWLVIGGAAAALAAGLFLARRRIGRA